MPNFTALLKEEISRLARKEIRAEMEAIKKTSTRQREQISELKTRVAALEGELRRVARGAAKAKPATVAGEAQDGRARRFSAKGFATWRAKMGLSAAAVAKLIDSNINSVLQWEAGTTKPRAAFQDKIHAIRGMGKKQLKALLEQQA